jgi:glucose-1-phosphate thymidylyltransferase
LPIYDKPLVYYPLSTLMLAGVRDILLISTPDDTPRFRQLLGDGSHLGLKFNYRVQERPEGIAHAFTLAEEFIGDDPVILILGDNIFYGDYDFSEEAGNFGDGGLIFAYYVKNPERYGVVEFDADFRPVSIEEKPAKPKSGYAVTGLYMYDSQVVSIAKALKPSRRGELEITDVNRAYLERGRLRVVRFSRGIAWLDTGTHDSMLDAANFIATIEKRQGQKIACIEEIAYRKGYINRHQVREVIDSMPDNAYRRYLEDVVAEADDGNS